MPVGTGLVLAGTRPAVLRFEMLLVAVIDQRVEVGHRLEHDVAAAAAIAAIRTAELDEFLTSEGGRTGANRHRSSGRSLPDRETA